MNKRIGDLKKNIEKLNDAGVRKTTYYSLLAESLKMTIGEPSQIRHAKAFGYFLDHVTQVVLPYELLGGSILGRWPVDEEVPDYEFQLKEARSVLEKYIQTKKEPVNEKKSGSTRIEDMVNNMENRFALMARDHFDASIDYSRLQKIIAILEEEYENSNEIEPNIIARELERHFNYNYGEETMRLLNELPWDVVNHADMNYAKVVQCGFGEILATINEKLKQCTDEDKEEFYTATKIAVEAAIRFIHRYAKTFGEAASEEKDPQRAAELKQISVVMEKMAEGKPESFIEAMQLMWITHIISNIAGGSALSFARFDQYMFPFYDKDIKSGVITRDEAKELLCCMWLKVNEPKMRTVQSLCVGGVTPEGADASNDLSRLCLETARILKLPYPNMSVRINSKLSPQWLFDEAIETIKAGFGQPMILNDEVWTENLMRLGYTAEIARDFYNMGCVEIMIQGKQPTWHNNDRWYVFPALLKKTLDGWKSGENKLDTFEDFFDAYLEDLREEVEAVGARSRELLDYKKKYLSDPFASALIDGCLENGLDVLRGGSECPAHMAIIGVGLGTTGDSLAAIKKMVYDDKTLTLDELKNALDSNFNGYEKIQALLQSRVPTYGNDVDSVDEITARVFKEYCDDVFNLNNPDQPEKYVNVLFSYTSHVYLGEITDATPNGRKKGEPLSDAVCPSQGKDTEGPTKMINSVLKLDYHKVTGALATNIKISPSLLNNARGTAALGALIRTYLEEGGPQIQVNFVKLEDLKNAQKEPAKYRNLVVRIAGFCEYFVNLDYKLQNEIIERTEHEVA